MKRMNAALALALCSIAIPGTASAQQATADTVTASKLALSRQIVAIAFPQEQREDLFFASVDQMTKQMRQSVLAAFDVDDAGLIAILDSWLADYTADSKGILSAHIPAIIGGVELAYSNMFTEQELVDILAFVSTPSGRQFIQRSPAVMAEPNFAAANQAYMDEVMAGLPAAQGKLRDRIVEYLSSKSQNQTNGS